MIVKLKFDMFYTTIEVPEISEKKLSAGIYDKITERCMHKDGLIFDDDNVIELLQETKFVDKKIKILEKHLWLDEISDYKPDITLYF